ncbi:hypothetical protein [Dyadobacter arcticus]|uniref:APCDD1 domain-containing protein n=1 Tax=Dyadobacter arcticus TaxID=1078754 RepID=A0ABX0UJG6_9BACT|nr:hypothetical protein [Dyadobacter arcticus]NIJ52633.1 hypothetical protein [Dyadobacter arcticus]
MSKSILITFISVIFLISSCLSQKQIIGKWVSESPENTAAGGFGTRQFTLGKESWEVRASVYLDSSLNFPVFTFRAVGKYTIGGKSGAISNAEEAVFGFDKKYITLKTKDTSLIHKYGFDKCDLIYLMEKDITDTGCAFFVSNAVCPQEFDLVSITGNTLYLGARPLSGGMCEEAKRPKLLGLPLTRIGK